MPSRLRKTSARLLLLLAVLALTAVPQRAKAQIVAVEGGFIRTEVFTHPMVEVFAAAPKVGFVRPYAIVSWSFDPSPFAVDDDGRPVVVTQLSVDTFRRGRVANNVAAGATWYPFHNYKPRASASTHLSVQLPLPNLSAFGLLSYVPSDESVTVLGGLSYTLLFRK